MNMYQGYNQIVKTPDGNGREICRYPNSVTVLYPDGRARDWPVNMVEVVTEKHGPGTAVVTTGEVRHDVS